MPPVGHASTSRFFSRAQTPAWHTPVLQHPDVDDPFLLALATADFSSPSLPPLSPSSRHTPTGPSAFQLPKPPGNCANMPPFPPHRRPPRTTRAAGVVDLTKEEPDHDDAVSILREAPASLPMPAPPRQHPAAAGLSSTSSSLRKRRASLTQTTPRPAKSRRPEEIDIGDDPFKEDGDVDHLFTGSPGVTAPTIDLSNATEVPQEVQVPKPDNTIKLGKFQCVICMDDVTALTVTHCGHLFCSECLHSALHIDSNKKTCPVCRTKVDLKNTKSKTSKGFFHLELKLMTTRKQGKRPAG
ncbi:E3 ubiquitin-protein ligase complex SLX5-SLX8 subunit SLX8 [Microdochium nivale]|nr:E3 ubiquitin-protein ligase complex SLX5-SLX8 subunit SLX8 [Microdochium nivale]